MQPRHDRLIEIFGDRIRLEQRHRVVDAQHRHFLVRRNGEEPVGTVVRLDVTELERDVLLAQHDRRALHPRAGLEAYEQVFRHDVLADAVAVFPRKSIVLRSPGKQRSSSVQFERRRRGFFLRSHGQRVAQREFELKDGAKRRRLRRLPKAILDFKFSLRCGQPCDLRNCGCRAAIPAVSQLSYLRAPTDYAAPPRSRSYKPRPAPVSPSKYRRRRWTASSVIPPARRRAS